MLPSGSGGHSGGIPNHFDHPLNRYEVLDGSLGSARRITVAWFIGLYPSQKVPVLLQVDWLLHYQASTTGRPSCRDVVHSDGGSVHADRKQTQSLTTDTPSRRCPSTSSRNSSDHLFEFVHEIIHDIDAAPALLGTAWRHGMFLGRCAAHGLERGSVTVESRGDPSERLSSSSFFFVVTRSQEGLAPCSVGGEGVSP